MLIRFISIFNLLISYCRQVISTEIGGGNLNKLFLFEKKICFETFKYNIHGAHNLCFVQMNGHETTELPVDKLVNILV